MEKIYIYSKIKNQDAYYEIKGSFNSQFKPDKA